MRRFLTQMKSKKPSPEDNLLWYEITNLATLAIDREINRILQEDFLQQTVSYLNFIMKPHSQGKLAHYIRTETPMIQVRQLDLSYWEIWANCIYGPWDVDEYANIWQPDK